MPFNTQMKAEEIANKIRALKPNLPNEEILKEITFKWNDDELSTWVGGFDINEDLREKVVEILEDNFYEKNIDYKEILRFILKQEIDNCRESETSTQSLRIAYDSLANLKLYEDIPLLLAANDETSFDANCALFKDRLFYNGYKNVMDYLKSNKNIDDSIIESMEYYGEYFEYNKENLNT